MGKLHVLTGDGKGKTSAGMGMVLRMAGYGKRVLVIQLMKNGTSGELRALDHLPEAVVLDVFPLQGFLWDMDADEKAELVERYHRSVQTVIDVCREKLPALVLLDELAPALAMGCISREDGENMINAALECGEAVVTGRSAPQWLVDRADYLTECRCLRHPYAAGLDAREGIEW